MIHSPHDHFWPLTSPHLTSPPLSFSFYILPLIFSFLPYSSFSSHPLPSLPLPLPSLPLPLPLLGSTLMNPPLMLLELPMLSFVTSPRCIPRRCRVGHPREYTPKLVMSCKHITLTKKKTAIFKRGLTKMLNMKGRKT